MSVPQPSISVEGATERNLANITCSIPLGAITLLSGASGAGKTTLALGVLAAESEFRRFFLQPPSGHPAPRRPKVHRIRNLPLVASLERTWKRSDPRTLAEVLNLPTHLKRYASNLEYCCPRCGRALDQRSPKALADVLVRTPESCSIVACFDSPHELLSWALPRGFSRLWRAGALFPIEELDSTSPGPWGVLVDTLTSSPEAHALIIDSIQLAGTASAAGALISHGSTTLRWHRLGWCATCQAPGLFDVGSLMRRIGTDLALHAAEFSTLRLQSISLHELFTERIAILRDRLSSVSDRYPTLAACIATLVEARLGHLSFNRVLSQLSTGECNRLRLLALLTPGVRYPFLILDEPLRGLHPLDQSATLKVIGSHAETCLLIDHHPEARAVASWEVELGPAGGVAGGNITYEGPVREHSPYSLSRTPSTVSRSYEFLSFTQIPTVPGKRISGTIPLGAITAITGVSGAGKTRFLFDGLLPLLQAAGSHYSNKGVGPPAESNVRFPTKPLRVVSLPIREQSTHPFSTVATLGGVYDQLRAWFVDLPLAKIRGYSAKELALGKRNTHLVCGQCRGLGILGDENECPQCHGARYVPEFLEVQWRGFSLSQILDQSITEFLSLGRSIPKVRATLTSLDSLGVSYLRLGQPTMTLSSGEFQRVAMAKELIIHERPTIFLLDEPSIGLAKSETRQLLLRLRELSDAGHTVFMIEHDPWLIAEADWQIELGPGAGPDGGSLIYMGVPTSPLDSHPR